MLRIKLLLSIFIISYTFLISKDYNSSSHTVTIRIPKTALLDIESDASKNISSNMTSTLETANHSKKYSDNRIRLDLTSIIGSEDARNITVKIEAQIPGLDLKVNSDNFSGSGFSSLDILNNEITLTVIDQILISGIESGYTVNGINNGFNIKYLIKNNNSKFGKTTNMIENDITVVYTLTH